MFSTTTPYYERNSTSEKTSASRDTFRGADQEAKKQSPALENYQYNKNIRVTEKAPREYHNT